MSSAKNFAQCLSWLGDSALQIDARQLEAHLGKTEGEMAPAWLAAAIAGQGWSGVSDVVPAYDVVTIHFSPRDAQRIKSVLQAWISQVSLDASRTRALISNQIEIPVCYEEPFAPDLKELARVHGLSCEEVIALHTAALYEVVMLGFSPGFPYLEGLDPRLATPRLATPRLSVPPGAVGIGGDQTGIYPTSSPGGWRLIGRTPLSLFNPAHHVPCLLAPGMRIRFVSITREQYRDIVQAMTGATAQRVSFEPEVAR